METIDVNSFSEFDDLMITGGQFTSWAFRGQGDASWPVLSSLSRHLQTYGVSRLLWPTQEARIVRIFKRKAHLHLNHVPEDDDDFQWLSIIQHYGGPTRLLDFTWSPYVAAYFALELARDDCAVYAVDTSAIGKSSDYQDLRTRSLYRTEYLTGKNKIVTQGEPALLNQRITAQHGTFIIPGVLDISLEQLIEEVIDASAIVKIVLKHSLRRVALEALYERCVENATLFPDLNGLAGSLRYELEHHWAYNANSGIAKGGFGDSPYALSLDTRINSTPVQAVSPQDK
jgi:FRG domain